MVLYFVQVAALAAFCAHLVTHTHHGRTDRHSLDDRPVILMIQPNYVQLVIPVGREADVTFELVNAHFQQVLETDDEILPDEVLEPPPFDLEELGFETEMTVAPGNTLGLTGLLHGRRRKRVADPFEPRQCSKST